MNKKILWIMSVLILIVIFVLLFNNKEKELDLKEEISYKKEFLLCSNKYELKYNSTVLLDKKTNIQTNSLKTILGGTLSFRVFDVSMDIVKIGFYINPKNYFINNRLQDNKYTEAYYNHVLLVKMDSNGQIMDIRLPRSLHKDDRKVPMSIIYPLQWIYDNKGQSDFKTNEADPFGSFESSYTLNKKNKLKYDDRAIEITSSETKSNIMSNSCWHKNLVFNENLLFKENEKVKMNTSTLLKIDFLSDLNSNDPLMQITNFDKLWNEYSKPSLVKQNIREKYIGENEYKKIKSQNKNLQDLIKSLKKGSKHELEDQLLAYLLNDPNALKEVEESIRDNNYDEYQMSVVLRVLGKMNTSKAQLLLSDVLVGLNSNEIYQFWAAVELGKQTTVIPSLVKDRLFDKVNDIGLIDSKITSASLYSLGMLSNTLSKINEDFSNDIKSNLLDALYSTTNVEMEKKSYLLGALGNTKSSEYMDIGKVYIKSDNNVIRQRAVTLINNSPNDEATVILEKQFLSDENDSLVRSKILNSLATRTHQDYKVIEEVKSIALNNESRVIHDSSINYLVIQLGPTKKNKEFFIELLGQESSESNALKLLNKIKTIK